MSSDLPIFPPKVGMALCDKGLVDSELLLRVNYSHTQGSYMADLIFNEIGVNLLDAVWNTVLMKALPS